MLVVCITCGGIDTQTIALTDLRALFASVAQDAALFDETMVEILKMIKFRIIVAASTI